MLDAAGLGLFAVTGASKSLALVADPLRARLAGDECVPEDANRI
jgi:uncharacterized membrane protein YeiH